MTDVMRIVLSPLVWLASFSAVYGLNGLLCSHGLVDATVGSLSVQRAILVGAYGLALALQASILVGLHMPRFASSSRFVQGVSVATGWAGFVAAAWSLMPVLTTTLC